MLASITHIIPLTTIERTRVMPVPGEITVRIGQKVRAGETIARATTNPRHYKLNAAAALGIPASKVAQFIERDVNETVEEGDILARRKGFAKRVLRAPKAGRIIYVEDGQILIQALSELFELKAGFPGTVSNIIGERGVILTTSGALVQAAWGNGHIEFGLMHVLAKSPDDAIMPEQIDVSQRGAVLLGGICNHPDTLRNGIEHRLRGLIVGGLANELVSLALKMPYPILVIDGLGRMPMNEAAFKLLSTNDKREVAVNAEPLNAVTGTRPEVVIPLPSGDQLEPAIEKGFLEVGQQVKIIRSPFVGKVGAIEAILPEPITFPNGLRTRAVNVRLDKETLVKVPIANLEILR